MHQDLLNHVGQNWESLAVDAPYFAVLTDPTYKEGPDDRFWLSGQAVANHILEDLAEAGIDHAGMSACELGSGVGRVLKAISGACRSATGYDLSKRMVNLCRQNCPGTPCHIYAGSLPGLKYDLVYSALVLQHNPPALIKDLLEDMFQSSRKAVWFQLTLPTGFEGEEKPEIPVIPMYGMTEGDVALVGAKCGFGMVSSKPNQYAGPNIGSRHYLFTRSHPISFSQCHQDQAAMELFGRGGSYLDIGCQDPVWLSNSMALEMHGWKGVCVDRELFDYTGRNCEYVRSDAVLALRSLKGRHFDYVSLDVDDDGIEVVNELVEQDVRFHFATVEHDKYRLGPGCQDAQYDALTKAGYARIFKDIHPTWNSSTLFEDWWCHPDVCDKVLGECLPSDQALEKIKSLDRC